MGLIKEDLTGKAEHRGTPSVGQFFTQSHGSNHNTMLLRSIMS
jgi:hypothetical protein